MMKSSFAGFSPKSLLSCGQKFFSLAHLKSRSRKQQFPQNKSKLSIRNLYIILLSQIRAL